MSTEAEAQIFANLEGYMTIADYCTMMEKKYPELASLMPDLKEVLEAAYDMGRFDQARSLEVARVSKSILTDC